MRSRLGREDGFTLIELSFAMVLLVIVVGSTQLLLTGAFRRNDQVQKQTDALQQARLGMEESIRLIRSQVCLTDDVYPVVSAGGTSFSFYADTTDAALANVPVKHTLNLNPTTKQLEDQQYTTNGTASDGTPLFPSTPTRTRVLAYNVLQDGTTPVFQYFGYPPVGSPSQPNQPLNSSSSPTVASGNLGSVAKVVVTLRAAPQGLASTTDPRSVLQDQAFARVSDPNFAAPNKTVPGPTCSF